MQDVTTASRAELMAVIAQQQATLAEQRATIAEQQPLLAELRARVQELERRLGGGPGRGMPGLKPTKTPVQQERRPRKRRDGAYVRHRAVPDERVVYAVDTCPRCQTRLLGGSVKRTREVLELEWRPVRVIEHVFLERRCPLCRQRHVPKAALGGLVLGRRRLGVGVLSLIATLREVGRLPEQTIQWYLQTFHQLQLSIGAITEALHAVAAHGAAAVTAIRDQLRASPVVHADETGWRQAGENGYGWTFSTPTARYFTPGSRAKEMVDTVLGEDAEAVLVCDFSGAYHHYAGHKQRCWAHLLRDVHELRTQHADQPAVQRWARAIHRLFRAAKRLAQTVSSAPERPRLQAQQRCEHALARLCQPLVDDATAPPRTLCARIAKHLQELFVVVAAPRVPAANNAAERSLRHLVTACTISGGTQSARGTQTKGHLSTLFGTWQRRGCNPFTTCRDLLTPTHS